MTSGLLPDGAPEPNPAAAAQSFACQASAPIKLIILEIETIFCGSTGEGPPVRVLRATADAIRR
jgi:hypothetical protein